MPSTGVWALMCSGPWPKAVSPVDSLDKRLGGMTITNAGGYDQPHVDRDRPRSQEESAAAASKVTHPTDCSIVPGRGDLPNSEGDVLFRRLGVRGP